MTLCNLLKLPIQEAEKESEFWNNDTLPVFQVIVEFDTLNVDISLLSPQNKLFHY